MQNELQDLRKEPPVSDKKSQPEEEKLNLNPGKNIRENYRKLILEIAVPVIIEQILIMALGMINIIMVGHIGKEAIAAVNMIDMLTQFIISFFYALAVGGTVIIARLVGQNNTKSINYVAKQTLYAGSILSLVLTLLLFILQKQILSLLYVDAEVSVIRNASIYFRLVILSYPFICLTLFIFGILRGMGDTKSPMKITLVMNTLNIFFSYILIYGLKINLIGLEIVIPALQIKGAALGITIAYLTGGVIALYLVFDGTRYLKLQLFEKFILDKKILTRVFKVGFPAGVEQMLMTGGKLILLTIIVGMGTVSIAAHSIGMSLMSVLYMPLTGFGIASTTLTGQKLGEADPNGAELITNKVIKLGMSVILPIAVTIMIFPNFFYCLYTFDQEVINVGSKIIRIFLCAIPFHVLTMVIAGSLRGAGDTRYCAYITFLSVWGFRLLLGYVLGVLLHMNIYGVWIGVGTDLVLRSCLFYFRFKKGKWKYIRV